MQERNPDNVNTLADKIESRLCDRAYDLDAVCPLIGAFGEARGVAPPSLDRLQDAAALAACEVAACAAPRIGNITLVDDVAKMLFERYFTPEQLERAAPTLLIDSYLAAHYALVESMARFLSTDEGARVAIADVCRAHADASPQADNDADTDATPEEAAQKTPAEEA